MGKDLKGKELGTGICQLKDGRYKARYTNRFGKRMPPIYSFSLKEVKELLNKAKYADGLQKQNTINKNITIQEVYEMWIDDKIGEIRETTRHRYMETYKSRISQYGFYKVVDINKDVIKEFISSLNNDGLAPSTIRNTKLVFSYIMAYAVEKNFCISNPVRQYKIPKTIRDKEVKRKRQNRETKFLTAAQRQVFLDYINSAKRCQLRDLYKFLLSTGLRVGEAIALKWEHVDLDNKTIFVQDGYTQYWENNSWIMNYYDLTKTPSSTQKIPICDAAMRILIERRSQMGDKATGLIFLNSKGNPLTYCNVHHSLNLLIERINNHREIDKLPKVTPHWFRHTFATYCLEQGVNLKAIQFYLRHAHLSMTADLYSHMTKDIANEEIQKINAKSELV